MDNQMKGKKGITLIALVITIIVLLILAGVAIATLTGDNGLLQKTTSAKQANEDAEIGEQIKLVYQEYQMASYLDKDTNAVTFITDKLQSTFGMEKVTNDAVTISNGKVIAIINGQRYIYNINTGVAKKYIDLFNYGEGKTKSDVNPGDTITVTDGTTTEQFKVFSTANGEIKAMSYYNLVLSSNPIKQGTAGTNWSQNRTTFSSINYWDEDENSINMADEKNNIQQYINAYKITLENIYGLEGIDVRVAKQSELNVNGITNQMRNPGGSSGGTWFWIGSGGYGSETKVCVVDSYGNFDLYNTSSEYNTSAGIRPIIIIH